MKSLIDTYTLNNGIKIPIVGFGTWQTPDGAIAKVAVKSALSSGYRHIDTAEMYGNEKSIGAAIKESGVSRNSLFITSKLSNSAHSYEKATAAIEKSLKDLQVSSLDLFLIHWPNPKMFRDTDWEKHLQDTWRALEDSYKAGKLKAIGVSNFKKHHFDILKETQTVKPMVNQIRICPGDYNAQLIEYCKSEDILLEAYSPLGTGKIFTDETIKELAEKNNRTVAQICLRWSLQHGFLPLPKSIHEDRIEENSHLFDFDLSASDISTIDSLKGIVGYVSDPDTAEF
ncbi:aldo/keto reductase [Liquorilactobacillus mali]|uniref:Aldo keto reductase family oxidoreductase n=1 Tax=Liquorilactobacillus mali KCTC 3596 = DSM 20444 TaxID=1046596 RepID=A0A0R2E183_9LACO|nr:aldo/keto reductase [Liquorilactobacillus mali]KRN09235.1 aldo keto reductase family oxidoreductase [Liquorilactobacillus mali KCTC 3596 = DSM 20444]MDC7952456.1 aldo/keto reductase [Liquorilactobacillus mali]QFQ75773.1 aldo/keto reductase [Liquorilactobacillus mali]